MSVIEKLQQRLAELEAEIKADEAALTGKKATLKSLSEQIESLIELRDQFIDKAQKALDTLYIKSVDGKPTGSDFREAYEQIGASPSIIDDDETTPEVEEITPEGAITAATG